MVKSKEWLTFWLFLSSFLVTLTLSILDRYVWKILIFPTWLISISVIVLVLSYIFRLYLKNVLGKAFHVNIVIRKNHEIVKKGPYKYLRHPMYLSTIFIFLGIAGMFSSILGIISSILLIIPTIIIRINKEEYFLEKKFGRKYKIYKNKTKKLIPGVY